MTLIGVYEKVMDKIPDLLLPCPFCGDSWFFVSDNTYGADYENKGYTVCCKCEFHQGIGYFKAKEATAKYWNHLVIEKIKKKQGERWLQWLRY